MVYTYTWKTNWIQGDESLWGIVEKFKLANVITGEGFFYTFCINRNAKFSKNYDGQSSISTLKNLSISKLNSVFILDFENYTKNFLSQMNIFKLNIPLFHKKLFFCKECLANAYHSIFHQLMIIEYCPFHPDVKLTSKCPSCDNDFRYYNFGAFEDAFCCENCNKSILCPNDFVLNKKNWGIRQPLTTPVYNKLNIKKRESDSVKFIFTIRYEKSIINSSYSKLVDLLNLNYKDLKKPYSIDKKQRFQLRYPLDKKIKRSYGFKEIMPEYLPFTISYIDRSLDMILFNQSKSILKVVEKYILRQYDQKTIREIKKCYGPVGYNVNSLFKSPFIEWKNECYGHWIYNIKYESYKTFDRKNRASDYEKQIFPFLHYSDAFRDDLISIISKVDSFSLIINLFSKLLFIYLYDRYIEIKNTYIEEDPILITPHILLKQDNQFIFN
ncbi:hypothetical protein VYF65_002990 [Lysinibacillus irui]|uniref:hypothetical protein n=1 Tax=Lysinibacillus irui TaxID=2998077 RepID=UPI0038875316